MTKKLKGSLGETIHLTQIDGIKSISVVWGDNYDSHAFMIEQILDKLEKEKYASREEIVENWTMLFKELEERI